MLKFGFILKVKSLQKQSNFKLIKVKFAERFATFLLAFLISLEKKKKN